MPIYFLRRRACADHGVFTMPCSVLYSRHESELQKNGTSSGTRRATLDRHEKFGLWGMSVEPPSAVMWALESTFEGYHYKDADYGKDVNEVQAQRTRDRGRIIGCATQAITFLSQEASQR